MLDCLLQWHLLKHDIFDISVFKWPYQTHGYSRCCNFSFCLSSSAIHRRKISKTTVKDIWGNSVRHVVLSDRSLKNRCKIWGSQNNAPDSPQDCVAKGSRPKRPPLGNCFVPAQETQIALYGKKIFPRCSGLEPVCAQTVAYFVLVFSQKWGVLKVLYFQGLYFVSGMRRLWAPKYKTLLGPWILNKMGLSCGIPGHLFASQWQEYHDWHSCFRSSKHSNTLKGYQKWLVIICNQSPFP